MKDKEFQCKAATKDSSQCLNTRQEKARPFCKFHNIRMEKGFKVDVFQKEYKIELDNGNEIVIGKSPDKLRSFDREYPFGRDEVKGISPVAALQDEIEEILEAPSPEMQEEMFQEYQKMWHRFRLWFTSKGINYIACILVGIVIGIIIGVSL